MDPTGVAIWVHLATHSKIRFAELLCRLCALAKQFCRNFLDARVARSLFGLYGCRRADVGDAAVHSTHCKQNERTAAAAWVVAAG
jgi:hypothetical protein